MTVEQLKALAYDQLIQLEQIQANLRIINDEITSKSKQDFAQDKSNETNE